MRSRWKPATKIICSNCFKPLAWYNGPTLLTVAATPEMAGFIVDVLLLSNFRSITGQTSRKPSLLNVSSKGLKNVFTTGSDANEAAFAAAFTYLTDWYFTTYIITRSSHRMSKKSQLKSAKRCGLPLQWKVQWDYVGTRNSETNTYILGCKFAMNISFCRCTDSLTNGYTDHEHNHDMKPDPLASDWYITA